MNFKIRQPNFLEILFVINFSIYFFMFITKAVPWNYAMLSVVAVVYILQNRFKIHNREVAFVVIIILTTTTLPYSMNKVEGLQKVFALIVFYFAFYKYLFEKIDVKYIENVMNTSIVISFIYLAICFYTFNDLLEPQRGYYLGTTSNQHNSAILIALVFLFMFVYIFNTKNNFFKLSIILSLIYLLYLSVSSYARVGFIMMGAFFFILLLYTFVLMNIKNKIKYIFYFILFSISCLFIFYDLIMHQFNGFFMYIDAKGLSGRDTIIYVLLNKLSEEYLFMLSGLGVGMIDMKIGNVNLRDAGSFFVVLYEGGLLLLTAWIVFILRYLILLFRIYKINKIKNHIKLFLTIPVAIIFNFADSTWVQYSNFDTVLMFIGIVMVEKIYFTRNIYKGYNTEN